MDQSQVSFTLTENAVARVAYLLADEPAGTVFVVSVLGGGCSGFQYHFDLAAKAPQAGDSLIEQGSARVLVDEVSMELLKGSVLDYTEDMAKAGFEIKNPNATAKCGCGNSFAI